MTVPASKNSAHSTEPSAQDRLEEYRRKVAGTNIDSRSLLSTDYFNTFNSVVMLLDMLPEMPELLDEAEQWKFYTYAEHFRHSGLDFADLAIEAYQYCPPQTCAAFEQKTNGMRIFVEEVTRTLRRLHDAGEIQTFGAYARLTASVLRCMMDEGGAIVHGTQASLNQNSIDKLF